jgi:hypothetical protein
MDISPGARPYSGRIPGVVVKKKIRPRQGSRKTVDIHDGSTVPALPAGCGFIESIPRFFVATAPRPGLSSEIPAGIKNPLRITAS